jgi:hypothetical protein
MHRYLQGNGLRGFQMTPYLQSFGSGEIPVCYQSRSKEAVALLSGHEVKLLKPKTTCCWCVGIAISLLSGIVGVIMLIAVFVFTNWSEGTKQQKVIYYNCMGWGIGLTAFGASFCIHSAQQYFQVVNQSSEV